ncbi:MAG: STAS domain-containing protein [Acidimicrobiales bacterium]
MLFDAQVTTRDGWVIVAFVGELDLATAPAARTAIVRGLGADAANLVLDLSGLDFLDSLGLGVVVSALKRVRARGGELVVVATEARIRAPFEVTGLDRLVTVHPSVDAALAVGAADG